MIIAPRTIILLVFAVTVLWMVIRSLKAMRLKERYAILMLVVGMPFFILAAWPDAIVFLSKFLNIEKPTLLVLGLTIFVVFIIFELLSIISVQERKIATLSQMMGILHQKQQEQQDKKLSEKKDE